jgi:hypothetical protein
MCDVNHTIPAAIATEGNNKPAMLPYRILHANNRLITNKMRQNLWTRLEV